LRLQQKSRENCRLPRAPAAVDDRETGSYEAGSTGGVG